MIFQNINEKMPVYRDCTFYELMMIAVVYFSFFGFAQMCLMQMLFGYPFVGAVMTLIFSVPAIRLMCGRLQRLKYGKPYGYYKHLFLRKTSGIKIISTFIRSPMLIREGKWSVRRPSK